MDVERAQALTDEAHDYVQDEITPLVYDIDNWNGVSEVQQRPGVTKRDSDCIAEAEQALSAAGRTPGLTKVMVPDESRGEWVDHGTWSSFEFYDGEAAWVETEVHFRSLTLTEGLAIARLHLAGVLAVDAPELRLAVRKTLRQVDEALAALGLAPDDPVVVAAGRTVGS